jgi:hypothetical protein
MQMKKKRTFFLWMATLFLLGGMPVHSQSLYVFKTDGSKQTFPLETLQKLTFSNNANLVVNKTNGTTVSVAFPDLKFLSLEDYEVTGIPVIPESQVVKEDVSVWSNNGIVWVKSARPIIGVNIFDLQGRKVAQLHPKLQEINISLANYPAGVYLVQVVDDNGIRTKKIIKK